MEIRNSSNDIGPIENFKITNEINDFDKQTSAKHKCYVCDAEFDNLDVHFIKSHEI